MKVHWRPWMCLVALTFASTPTTTLRAQPLDRRTAIVKAIEKTADAIVNIRTMRTIPARFDETAGGGRVKGLGTGVIIDPRGYVVTNYHVVENVDTITVMTSRGERYTTTVLRFNQGADLAVLKFEPRDPVAYLPLYGPNRPLLGETVIAIGNPYGLENSVTTGIVSAVNRELQLPNGEVFSHLIQTDASINPGNSGGPLLDINGELLGINVAIRANAQGIGFAIPTGNVRRIVERMMGGAEETLAAHGLFVAEIVPRPRENPGTMTPVVRISKVAAESSAEKLGFRVGDQILAVAGQKVRVSFDIERNLWGRGAGDSIVFEVRGAAGESRTLTLAVTQLSDEEVVWDAFGVRVQAVPSAELLRLNANFKKLRGGLRILQVADGSAAQKVGFRVGDVLIGLHGYETINANNVRYIMELKDLSAHQPITYHLVREQSIVEGKLQMPAFP